MLKKIVVIGPESTGKSTLCQQLATHFNTTWVPEYARAYLTEYGTTYTYDDLLKIAHGQVEQEDKIAQEATSTSSPLLFIDTDLYVMKVWSEFVFGKCHQWILDNIATRKYDLYLLCNIDLPWVADELREYPTEEPRIQLYNIYKDLMINQAVPWIEISGHYDERLQKAINAVDALLKK
ncbi:MAG: ATP-binding protein [Chitinophagaceae bacterium]